MKFKNLTLVILAFFALQACDDNDAYFGSNDGDGVESPSYSRISDLIKFDNVPTDSLAFDPTEMATVEGTFGTQIRIQANSFEPVSADVEIPDELYVLLREYPTITKMALGNVQTVSDQELLVTGGNFWWKVVDADGNDYSYSSSAFVDAAQPIQLDMGDYTEQASYFEGEVVTQDGQEVLNWTLGTGFESMMDAENNVFSYYGIKLGWANCDALYSYDTDERTQFRAMINSEATLQEDEQMVLFVVDDFPSLVNITSRDGDYFVTYDDSIPVGISGSLVAIALDLEGNILIGSTDITVQGDDEYQIDVVEGTMSEFTNLLNLATN